MTTAEITAQIAAKNASIAAYLQKKANLESERAVSQSSYNNCSGIGKKKCQENRQKEINQWQAQIDATATTISQLQGELNALKDTLKAANKAELELAEKGQSQAALEIVATGQAEAIKSAAKIEAQAKADVITTEAPESSKRKTIITMAVVIGVLIVVMAIVIPRVLKNKNLKK